jgi:hypothetical protein
VANFVETEQVLETAENGIEHNVSSFVQVRGSIPLLWKQKSSRWQLQSDIHMRSDSLTRQAAVLRSHLNSLHQKYCVGRARETNSSSPSVVMVNLVDRKGTQGRLGVWLQCALRHMTSDATPPINRTPSTHFNVTEMPLNRSEVVCEDFRCVAPEDESFLTRCVWFDYHHKCRDTIVNSTNMRDINRSNSTTLSSAKELFPLVRSALSLKEGGYFVGNRGADGETDKVQWLQSRVVRTNCIDCLDRTNVVQVQWWCDLLLCLFSTICYRLCYLDGCCVDSWMRCTSWAPDRKNL